MQNLNSPTRFVLFILKETLFAALNLQLEAQILKIQNEGKDK